MGPLCLLLPPAPALLPKPSRSSVLPFTQHIPEEKPKKEKQLYTWWRSEKTWTLLSSVKGNATSSHVLLAFDPAGKAQTGGGGLGASGAVMGIVSVMDYVKLFVYVMVISLIIGEKPFQKTGWNLCYTRAFTGVEVAVGAAAWWLPQRVEESIWFQ